jgi:hypothetical protein
MSYSLELKCKDCKKSNKCIDPVVLGGAIFTIHSIGLPLYQFMPYRKGRIKKQLSPERKAMAIESLRKAREATILSSKI